MDIQTLGNFEAFHSHSTLRFAAGLEDLGGVKEDRVTGVRTRLKYCPPLRKEKVPDLLAGLERDSEGRTLPFPYSRPVLDVKPSAVKFGPYLLAAGDYIGDCFVVKVVPQGTALKSGQNYYVSGQKNLDDDDRELTLLEGSMRYIAAWPPLNCRPTGGSEHKVKASDLIEAGASRQGYTDGLLTMPYKYFPNEKSFVINAPVGGYLGWRDGLAGSGRTVAVALTLSSVSANTVDPNQPDSAGKPTVTGTTTVAALSFAGGMMFDILKSPRGKPFKTGVFFGRDVVSKDPTIDYRFNRKTWVAIQIGYDFTDNWLQCDHSADQGNGERIELEAVDARVGSTDRRSKWPWPAREMHALRSGVKPMTTAPGAVTLSCRIDEFAFQPCPAGLMGPTNTNQNIDANKAHRNSGAVGLAAAGAAGSLWHGRPRFTCNQVYDKRTRVAQPTSSVA